MKKFLQVFVSFLLFFLSPLLVFHYTTVVAWIGQMQVSWKNYQQVQKLDILRSKVEQYKVEQIDSFEQRFNESKQCLAHKKQKLAAYQVQFKQFNDAIASRLNAETKTVSQSFEFGKVVYEPASVMTVREQYDAGIRKMATTLDAEAAELAVRENQVKIELVRRVETYSKWQGILLQMESQLTVNFLSDSEKNIERMMAEFGKSLQAANQEPKLPEMTSVSIPTVSVSLEDVRK